MFLQQSPLIHTQASPDGGPAARAHRDATSARVADHSFTNTTTLGPDTGGLRRGSSPKGARPRGRGRGSGWGPGLGDGCSRGRYGLVASCWRRWLGDCTVQCIIIIAIIFKRNRVNLRMYLWWSLCTLYWSACQLLVTILLFVWHLSNSNQLLWLCVLSSKGRSIM